MVKLIFMFIVNVIIIIVIKYFVLAFLHSFLIVEGQIYQSLI